MHIMKNAQALHTALKRLHNVLDTRLSNGLAVNQVLPKEVTDLFYGPAIEARVALAQSDAMNNAAPTMYATLQFIRNFYQDNFENMPVAFQTIDNLCEAAMAQAEGRD
jgi:hypothetical protein